MSAAEKPLPVEGLEFVDADGRPLAAEDEQLDSPHLSRWQRHPTLVRTVGAIVALGAAVTVGVGIGSGAKQGQVDQLRSQLRDAKSDHHLQVAQSYNRGVFYGQALDDANRYTDALADMVRYPDHCVNMQVWVGRIEQRNGALWHTIYHNPIEVGVTINANDLPEYDQLAPNYVGVFGQDPDAVTRPGDLPDSVFIAPEPFAADYRFVPASPDPTRARAEYKVCVIKPFAAAPYKLELQAFNDNGTQATDAHGALIFPGASA